MQRYITIQTVKMDKYPEEEQRRNQETLVPLATKRHINSEQQERLNVDTGSEPQLQTERREPRTTKNKTRITKNKTKSVSTFEKHLKEYTV